MKCPICKQHLEINGSAAIETDTTMTFVHPDCYDIWEAKCIARQQARQAARQQKMRTKLKQWNSLASK